MVGFAFVLLMLKSAKVKQLLKTMAAPSDEKLTNLLISFV